GVRRGPLERAHPPVERCRRVAAGPQVGATCRGHRFWLARECPGVLIRREFSRIVCYVPASDNDSISSRPGVARAPLRRTEPLRFDTLRSHPSKVLFLALAAWSGLAVLPRSTSAQSPTAARPEPHLPGSVTAAPPWLKNAPFDVVKF